MKPHLIIDMRDRTLFSLLIDSNGNIRPCTHHIGEHTLRYFFGEILLNLELYDMWLEKQNSDQMGNTNDSKYDIMHIGKTLGWLWPYQKKNDDMAITINHPLKVLSSFLPLENSETIKSIMIACYGILDFILEPLFQNVLTTVPDLSQINVIAIIPNYFNRRALSMLRQILIRKKCHRIFFIPREMATIMSYMEISAVDDAIVLDMENEDTHLYEMSVLPLADTLQLQCTGISTLPKFGWQSLVNQFIEILVAQQVLAAPVVRHQASMDKELVALIFGMNTSQPKWPSSLKISHGLFDRLFTGTDAESPMHHHIAKLRAWLDKKENKSSLIPLGLPAMVGKWENLFCQELQNQNNPHGLLHRSLERTAYGMAAGLKWLHQGTARSIRFVSHASLRIATRPDESFELVPYSRIPILPGESNIIKQVLDFRLEENINEDTLHFQLLWGMNALPQYNTHVCLIVLNVRQEDLKKNRKIWVTLHLKRTDPGNHLIGSMMIRLGEYIKTTRFTLEHTSQEVQAYEIR